MNLTIIRRTAACIALAYILIQSFQWYVFAQFPVAANVQEELMQGNHTLHITRSWLMLLSMFGLMIVNITICYIASKINIFWSVIAMIGFLTFFLLEISLRSVELFYTQLYLPQQALNATTTAMEGILDKFSTFTQIQQALYFPLIFSTTISYVVLFFLFPSAEKIHRIIKLVMGINILRSVWRISADFLHISWLQGSLYNTLYLPLVVLLFGLTAWWLLKLRG